MLLSVSAPELVNFILISGGLFVCALCFLHVSGALHLRRDVRRYFQLFFALIALYLASHLARQMMDGLPGQGVRTALHLVTFVEILAAGLMSHMLSMLLLAVVKLGKSEESSLKPYVVVLTALLALHTVLLMVGSSVRLIYYFDAQNVYHRAAGYLLSNIGPLGMLCIDVFLLIRYGRHMDRLVRIAFWNYMIAPIIAIVLQVTFYRIQFISVATVGAAVVMFGVIVKRQNDRYAEQQAENSRIETELSMASNIQTSMLPSIFPPFPEREEIDLYASMTPAKEVGGDFYDFFLVDEDHLCMVMADVSGKGVPAALFMMACKIILANNAMMGKSPAQILTDANAAICSKNREEMFVTVWLGILEISTGKLTAANAGHEYPVLKQADGQFELVKDKHGFVVGGMEGMQYKQYELTVRPGSKLFLYTDGVPEATDADGQMFGTERMLAALNHTPGATPEQVLQDVKQAVDEFVGSAEQFDDLTMLCAEYRGPVGNK